MTPQQPQGAPEPPPEGHHARGDASGALRADVASWDDPDWHYAGFGITHAGQREECEPCILSRLMVIAAAYEPYTWFRTAGDQ